MSSDAVLALVMLGIFAATVGLLIENQPTPARQDSEQPAKGADRG